MSRTRSPRFAPRIVAGLAGMALVAALFIANGLLLRNGGRGLSAAWLLTLALPGALATYLSVARGTQYAGSWAKESVLAGAMAGHLTAAVWVAWLAVGVTTTDWAQYSLQVGPQTANAVRDAALPATIVASVAAVMVAYAGCVSAAWLGAAGYVALRELFRRGTKRP
jgi:hypothetical protein